MASALLLLKAYAAWRTGSVLTLGSPANTTLDLLAPLVLLAYQGSITRRTGFVAIVADNVH